MKMKLFEPLVLKFEETDWARNPEFGLIDTVLEKRPELYRLLEKDITGGEKKSEFGRGDSPSVEQIVRAAIYKEIKQMDYRELEFAQTDSRICEKFIRIDPDDPYSFQVFQKYISRIKYESLEKFMVELNKIAIEEGIEDLRNFRQDSTVVETNIHYPTNNSLVWDCIKTSQRLLEQLNEEIQTLSIEDYRTSAKKTYFKINVTKQADERIKLFMEQLQRFTQSINQVSNIVKKKSGYGVNPKITGILVALEQLLPHMRKVYEMTERKEVKGEQVPNGEKLFSIYEVHTDIIVKGARKIQFGHKINLSTGSGSLIMTCEIPRGNPGDSTLYQSTLGKFMRNYGTPDSSVTDGGFASLENQKYARDNGIKNIVFNKIVGSLKNITVGKSIEERLKKWRSGIEAVISNLKRGFDLFRCNWKGEQHFRQKVFWSIIAYNIRVMTGSVLKETALSA
jgi:IS5 family transposase